MTAKTDINRKSEARLEFFSNWHKAPISGMTETFNTAYEYGFKDGHREGHKDGYHEATHAQAPTAQQVLVAEPGYEKLVGVLRQAHDHAAKGKGLERHANELPFEQQRMLSITRQLKSPRGLAYQVIKKITEGLDLPTHRQQVAELLGAINYAAGIVIYLNEQEAAKPVPTEQATDAAAPAQKMDPISVHIISTVDGELSDLAKHVVDMLSDLKPRPPTDR